MDGPIALLVLLVVAGRPPAAIDGMASLAGEVRAASFPELGEVRIRFRTLNSTSDYFQSRFTLASFFFLPRLRFVILCNPKAIAGQVPPEAMRAILAHELAHTEYFHSRRRLALLPAAIGLLLSRGFRARFERQADLRAIELGYGQGLKQYRLWLYGHIPPERVREKKRDYLSPEEIDAAVTAAGSRTSLSPR